MNHVLDGDPDQPCKGAIFRGKDMPDDLLPWAVQRQLNRWRCCLGCGLWWAQGSITWGAYWHNLANTTEPSMCGSDATFLSNYFDRLFLFRTQNWFDFMSDKFGHILQVMLIW